MLGVSNRALHRYCHPSVTVGRMLVHLWQDGVRVRPNAFQDRGVEPLRAERVYGFLAPRQTSLGIDQGRHFLFR